MIQSSTGRPATTIWPDSGKDHLTFCDTDLVARHCPATCRFRSDFPTLGRKRSLDSTVIGAANIHDGAVRSGCMETPFGAIPVAGPDAANAAICWRPETAQPQGSLSGRVTATAFQGGFTDVTVAESGEALRLQLPGTRVPMQDFETILMLGLS